MKYSDTPIPRRSLPPPPLPPPPVSPSLPLLSRFARTPPPPPLPLSEAPTVFRLAPITPATGDTNPLRDEPPTPPPVELPLPLTPTSTPPSTSPHRGEPATLSPWEGVVEDPSSPPPPPTDIPLSTTSKMLTVSAAC